MFVTVNIPHKNVSHKFYTYVYDLPLHNSNEDTRDNTTDLSFHKTRERGAEKNMQVSSTGTQRREYKKRGREKKNKINYNKKLKKECGI